MLEKLSPKWRTFILVIVGFAVLLGGLDVCLVLKASEGFFDSFRSGVVLLVALGASKSAVEHLANGTGIGGALKVLFTAAKPGGDASPPEVKP